MRQNGGKNGNKHIDFGYNNSLDLRLAIAEWLDGTLQSIFETSSSVGTRRNSRDWDAVGFKRPRIVYWNTAGYAGSPDTVRGKNVAMVSGFSTGILKSVLAGDDFSPEAIMLRALEKYTVENPLFGDFADI